MHLAGIRRRPDRFEGTWCADTFWGARLYIQLLEPRQAPWHQIQFLPVACLPNASDKCEFDMTLSKSDVMEMHLAYIYLCFNNRRSVREGTKTNNTAVTLLETRVNVNQGKKAWREVQKGSNTILSFHKLKAERTQRGGLEEEGKERCFMVLSCRQTKPWMFSISHKGTASSSIQYGINNANHLPPHKLHLDTLRWLLMSCCLYVCVGVCTCVCV